MKPNIVNQFELIVTTLLSNHPVQPLIIKAHISQYAKEAGITYELARQAIIIVVKDRLQQKLVEL